MDNVRLREVKSLEPLARFGGGVGVKIVCRRAGSWEMHRIEPDVTRMRDNDANMRLMDAPNLISLACFPSEEGVTHE